MNVTFVTGNQRKTNFLAKYLGFEVAHQKLDIDELQSLDLREVTKDKVLKAYKQLKTPVLVEDVSLVFNALGNLPGPLIKWFEQELGLEGMCRLLDGYSDRSAIARVTYAYYNGKKVDLFEGEVAGTISKNVHSGPQDFGWNSIFIPKGSTKTYAEMTEDEVKDGGLRTSTIYPNLKRFLASIDKK